PAASRPGPAAPGPGPRRDGGRSRAPSGRWPRSPPTAVPRRSPAPRSARPRGRPRWPSASSARRSMGQRGGPGPATGLDLAEQPLVLGEGRLEVVAQLGQPGRPLLVLAPERLDVVLQGPLLLGEVLQLLLAPLALGLRLV